MATNVNKIPLTCFSLKTCRILLNVTFRMNSRYLVVWVLGVLCFFPENWLRTKLVLYGLRSSK